MSAPTKLADDVLTADLKWCYWCTAGQEQGAPVVTVTVTVEPCAKYPQGATETTNRCLHHAWGDALLPLADDADADDLPA
jgi:hypothetical protein